MKFASIGAAALGIAVLTPAFAQDKSTTEAPMAVSPKAQKNAPSKRHSHMEDRQGMKATDQTASDPKPADPKKHSHPKDR